MHTLRRDSISSSKGTCLRLVLAVLVLAMLPLGAAAQSAAAPDRVELRLGMQAFTQFTSAVRVDSASRGIGTQLRLETDVALDERTRVARADLVYHFNARHHVVLASYDIERTGTRDVSRQIRFGEQTFDFGTSVSASFDEEVVKLAYGYNVLLRPRATLGPSFGLHVMRFEVGLAVSALSRSYEARTTAPLPVVGVRGHYRIGDRWAISGALDLFDVEVGDVKGVFRDVILTFEHDTFDRIGFGFGFNLNSLDVSSGDDDFRGIIDLSFRSAMVYVKGGFGTRTSR
ncbi:MAG TPA: hypothetical protein VF339_08790 [Gammaproteobacteria bacterium]